MRKTEKSAFTLAEVLITLGIIGVVAAMTLPTLIAKYQEQVTINHLMKTYSMLSQAVQRMQTDYGTIDTWGLENTDTGITDPETGERVYDWSAQRVVAERLKQYLKVTHSCELNKVCIPIASYTISGKKISDSAIVTDTSSTPPEGNFFLSDGTIIGIGWYTAALNHLDIVITLPPIKNKIVLGKNRFYLNLSENRLLPEGTAKDGVFYLCNPMQTEITNAGRGCAAWVIYNKNMDYLHCREKLSWSGKHSCKE